MSRAARLGEILGLPGLLIGLFSIASFVFGLVVLAREYDRLRVTGRKALGPVVAGWVRGVPVHYLGWTLPDYADRLAHAPSGEVETRREALRQALRRLGSELDRPSRQAPLIEIVAMTVADSRGRPIASWTPETPRSPDDSDLRQGVPLSTVPPMAVDVTYRVAPDVRNAALGLEASYHRLVLAVSGLSGYSLLCLIYMVSQARSLRDRAAREAAQAATLDLADRTCHELGNVAFVLANERVNLAGVLDLFDRFVAETDEALRSAASRAGLSADQAEKLVKALSKEHSRRGLDPAIELRSASTIARDVARQVAVSSDYISLTVRELDAYLKQSSIPVAPGPLSIAGCLDDAEALLAPALESSSAKVIRRGDPAMVAVADRRLLVHSLVNLLKNAVEAASTTGRTPEIVVEVTRDESRVVVAIEDNGPGIDPKRLARIFELGYSTKGPGRGRGLAIVKDSIEAQGGELIVESTVGKGTRFQIRLPQRVG